MISYSFRTLGSEELQEQVLKDIDDLLRTCQLEKFLPLHLVVGKTFLEISCAQYLRSELQVKDWDHQVLNNYETLSEMYDEIKLNTIRKCEKNYGVFDVSNELVVYFDPEEEYLSIHAVNPSKIKRKSKKELDKRCIEVLRYEEEDVLKDFNPELYNQ